MRFAKNPERPPLPSAGLSVSAMLNYQNECTLMSRLPELKS